VVGRREAHADDGVRRRRAHDARRERAVQRAELRVGDRREEVRLEEADGDRLQVGREVLELLAVDLDRALDLVHAAREAQHLGREAADLAGLERLLVLDLLHADVALGVELQLDRGRVEAVAVDGKG
jgi:hypothetical protein